jgi:fatty acid desaturase
VDSNRGDLTVAATEKKVVQQPLAAESFPIEQARRIVEDLMAPRPWIYWVDFGFHAVLGWTAFILSVRLAPFSPLQLLAFTVAALALYRSVLFIHELAHRKPGSFRAFRNVWNLTCGFPLMVPSFLYTRVHSDHHTIRTYGTHADGEYVAFGAQPPRNIVLYLLQIFALPFLFPLRFTVVAPLSHLHPRLRELAWQEFSSLTIDFHYRRPPPSAREGNGWRLQELGAFLYGATFITLIATGVAPFRAVIVWYCAVLFVFLLNSLRTLAAHAYANPGDQRMNLSAQFLDSVDIPGNPVTTPLWAPLGLRYHATHHLFPTMPYHSLGAAYRRLARELPTDARFLDATRASLAAALERLWQEAKASSEWPVAAEGSGTRS